MSVRRLLSVLSLSSLLPLSGLGTALASGAAPPAAGAPTRCAGEDDSATARLRRSHADLVSLYRNALPGPAGRELLAWRVANLVERNVDIRTFARETLTVAWEAADAATRERWERILGNMLRQRYLSQIRHPDRFTVTIGEATQRCDRATVRAVVEATARRVRSELLFELVWRAGIWRAWDVRVDGVSLAETGRGRYERLFREGGVAAVDAHMERLDRRYSASPRAAMPLVR